MKIIPKRGLSINNVHAPEGIPVECEDGMAKELILLDVARRAPATPPAPASPAVEPAPAPTVEAASAVPVTESAAAAPVQSPRKRRG